MKKVNKLFFIILGTIFLTIGCGSTDNDEVTKREESGNENTDIHDDPVCTEHIDVDNDGKCDICEAEVPIVLSNFEHLSFESQEFTYDGEPHSISVTGAPDFATVTYENNEQTEIGSYLVQATLVADKYKTLTLNAFIIINPKKFLDLKMESASYKYDGEIHSLFVEGAPENATITYENNNQKEVGTYLVKANVSLEHYQSVSINAYLTITRNNFENVKFEDAVFNYDGNPHSIYATGIPDFATVKYFNNNQSGRGKYNVLVQISAPGYETLSLQANMTIANVLPNVTLLDQTLTYTGEYQAIPFELPTNLPENTVVTYELDGEQFNEVEKFVIKTIGEHRVSITLSNDVFGYYPSTTSAIITVVE